MAGHDHKVDTRGNIANYIERKIRDLLEYNMNEYQDPAWVQAAEVFNEIVVPCEIYCSGGLYTLGIDIVKEAENHGSRVVYQRIPGMYNVKLVSGDDYSEDKVDMFDYSKTVNSIKACPYCKSVVHLEDFFENIKYYKGNKDRVTKADFKGERIGYTRMWACPSCDTILGFSQFA